MSYKAKENWLNFLMAISIYIVLWVGFFPIPFIFSSNLPEIIKISLSVISPLIGFFLGGKLYNWACNR